MPELFRLVEAALLEDDPTTKCSLTADLRESWQHDGLHLDRGYRVLPIDDPGRPRRPELVDPRRLERRSFATAGGRQRLLHAFAHIEFNAINIALDAVYRYRRMPREFVADWLRVAAEEALHFDLLRRELERRGSHYGAFPAHAGLWDMVCKTRDDVLHRMALVPRVMEARGLDVTPGMIARFEQFGDRRAADILRTIYRDEIGHVRIGNFWFCELCRERNLDAPQAFRHLVSQFMGSKLRGPFNRDARIAAGFDPLELDRLEKEF